MPNDTNGRSGDTTPTRLTVGQRILAALPQLQRPSSDEPTPGSSAPVPKATPASKTTPKVTGTWQERLRESLVKPAPAKSSSADPKRPYKDVPSAELVHGIKYLDDKERKLAFLAAPLGVALTLVVMFETLRSNPAVGHKNHADPTQIVITGLVSILFAAVVVTAAIFRRRSFVVFSLVFLGYGAGPVSMLPLWGLAGWMFLRSTRYQKELTLRGENPRAQAAAERRERARQRQTGSRRKAAAAKPTGPAQNKRYTPPKPPPARKVAKDA